MAGVTSGPTFQLYPGDCVEVLGSIPSGSVDAIVTDPPYPEIDRDYGRMSEAAWHQLMRDVVTESRRVLKPSGSAVFILQPNSERVGRMRPWLWEFMAWTAREWNQVQDAYWWNVAAVPTVHCHRRRGLMRPSVKPCVWLGAPDCYRDQSAVLWSASEASKAADRSDRALRRSPSGMSTRSGRMACAADERGGVTPFNVLPIANTNSTDSAGSHGHGAGTPAPLANWWIRYLTRPGDFVADPFAGSGTMGVEALRLGRSFLGIEKHRPHYRRLSRRIGAASAGRAA